MNTVELARQLTENHNKKELASIARGFGWRGDDARATILSLALYVATKSTTAKDSEAFGTDSSPSEASTVEASTAEDSTASDGTPAEASTSEDSTSEDAPAEASTSEDAPSEDAPTEASTSEDSTSEDAPAEDSTSDSSPSEDAPSEDAPAEDAPSEDAPSEDAPSEDAPAEEEPPQHTEDEFEALLKQSGIINPHKMLHKCFLLAVKAKQNILLVGPAGSGKTMLGQQLSQLLGVMFGSISCSMGMSESQLSGWLLPLGKKGKFEYKSAPFIDCIQQKSVFLLDELDGSDANVLLMLNSVLANGFITIPHKLNSPTVLRHADSIIIAGCNGSGEQYQRNVLDGATMDRFYEISVDYDKDYMSSLFGGKAKRKSPHWKPVAPADELIMQDAKTYFYDVANKLKKSGLSKIWGTRVAQKMTMALEAGIPFDEIKADLFTSYTADEIARLL